MKVLILQLRAMRVVILKLLTLRHTEGEGVVVHLLLVEMLLVVQLLVLVGQELLMQLQE